MPDRKGPSESVNYTEGNAPQDTTPLLRIDSIVTGYGRRQVLNRVSLEVKRQEIVAVIGHNGAGKTTLLKAVFGIIPIWRGHVIYDGVTLDRPEPLKLLQAGVAYVPQGNQVFGDLTVRENLEVASVSLTGPDRKSSRRKGVDRAFREFSVLKQRLRQRAATLSGGEKQMLALGMSLVLSPRLVLLDEPSLGLAPPLVKKAFQRIDRLRREHGMTVLVVEQKVAAVLRIADWVVAIRAGRVAFSGPAAELRDDEAKLREVYL